MRRLTNEVTNNEASPKRIKISKHLIRDLNHSNAFQNFRLWQTISCPWDFRPRGSLRKRRIGEVIWVGWKIFSTEAKAPSSRKDVSSRRMRDRRSWEKEKGDLDLRIITFSIATDSSIIFPSCFAKLLYFYYSIQKFN